MTDIRYSRRELAELAVLREVLRENPEHEPMWSTGKLFLVGTRATITVAVLEHEGVDVVEVDEPMVICSGSWFDGWSGPDYGDRVTQADVYQLRRS